MQKRQFQCHYSAAATFSPDRRVYFQCAKTAYTFMNLHVVILWPRERERENWGKRIVSFSGLWLNIYETIPISCHDFFFAPKLVWQVAKRWKLVFVPCVLKPHNPGVKCLSAPFADLFCDGMKDLNKSSKIRSLAAGATRLIHKRWTKQNKWD